MKLTITLLLVVFALSAMANMADPRYDNLVVFGIDNDLYTATLEFILGEAILHNVKVNQWIDDDPLQGYFIPLTLAPVASHTEFIIKLPALPVDEGEYKFHLLFEPSGTEWIEELGYGIELQIGDHRLAENLTAPYLSVPVSAEEVAEGGWLNIECREFFAVREGTETLRVFVLNLAVAILPVESSFEDLAETHFDHDAADTEGYWIELPLVEPIR